MRSPPPACSSISSWAIAPSARRLLGPWTRVAREGLVAGLAGAVAVAVWFLLYDLAAGMPLRTPALLGATLFHGLRDPSALVITRPAGAPVHGRPRPGVRRSSGGRPRDSWRWPIGSRALLFGVFMLFCCFEVFFIALVAILAEWLFETLAWWTILAGNLLASFVDARLLLPRAPGGVAGVPGGAPLNAAAHRRRPPASAGKCPSGRSRRTAARREPTLHRMRRSRLDSSAHKARAHREQSTEGSRVLSPFDLKGRVAVVTGGNGGIGLGMARGMAAAGAAIVVAARNREKSARAVKELEGLGAQAVAIDVDVTDEASVNALVRTAVGAVGTTGRAREQCRHQYPKAAAGADARRVAPGARHQPDQRLPVRAAPSIPS